MEYGNVEYVSVSSSKSRKNVVLNAITNKKNNSRTLKRVPNIVVSIIIY